MQQTTSPFSEDMAVLARAVRLGAVSLISAAVTAALVIAGGGALGSQSRTDASDARLIPIVAR